MAGEAGQGCVDRASSGADYTIISYQASSTSGNVNKCRVYGSTAGTEDVEFAMMKYKSADKFSPQSPAENSGTITDGVDGSAACYEFDAGTDYTVFESDGTDYLGCWCSANQEYTTSGGVGVGYEAGDKLSTPNYTYVNGANFLDGISADIGTAAASNTPSALSLIHI